MKEKKCVVVRLLRKILLTIIVAEKFSMVSSLWKAHGLIYAINNLSLETLLKLYWSFHHFNEMIVFLDTAALYQWLSPSLVPPEELMVFR